MNNNLETIASNSPLDARLRTRIFRDYETANSIMNDLLRGGRNNDKIKEFHYLNPKVDSTVNLPLNDPKSLFSYYDSVLVFLKRAITEGYVPKELLPSGAPTYLQELTKSPLEKFQDAVSTSKRSTTDW